MTPPEEFHLKEFESLRSEIELTLKELRDLERYVLVTTAGIWVWVITQEAWNGLLWMISVLVVVLGGVRALTQFWHLAAIGDYIDAQLESIVFATNGWENFLQKRRNQRWLQRSVSDYAVWIVLLLLTSTALVVTRFADVQKSFAKPAKPPIVVIDKR